MRFLPVTEATEANQTWLKGQTNSFIRPKPVWRVACLDNRWWVTLIGKRPHELPDQIVKELFRCAGSMTWTVLLQRGRLILRIPWCLSTAVFSGWSERSNQ